MAPAGASAQEHAGFSLVELLTVAALVIVLTIAAVPATAGVMDEIHASEAARYLVARLRLARLEAVKRSASVGIRFLLRDGRYEFAAYVDGNGDGVRSRDIGRGIDSPIAGVESLWSHFPGVDFGLLPGVPAIDEASSSTDPIRLGASDILSFSPGGSATSGTLYVRGRGSQQYALRILGVTGRVRLWRYDVVTQRWNTH